MEVPRLWVEWQLQLQLQPTLQSQQHQIPATSVTHTACNNARSLIHWVRPGIEPASLQRLCQVLNLLNHSRNFKGTSLFYILKPIITQEHCITEVSFGQVDSQENTLILQNNSIKFLCPLEVLYISSWEGGRRWTKCLLMIDLKSADS